MEIKIRDAFGVIVPKEDEMETFEWLINISKANSISCVYNSIKIVRLL